MVIWALGPCLEWPISEYEHPKKRREAKCELECDELPATPGTRMWPSRAGPEVEKVLNLDSHNSKFQKRTTQSSPNVSV